MMNRLKALGVAVLIVALGACSGEGNLPPEHVSGPPNHTTNVRTAKMDAGVRGLKLDAVFRLDTRYRIKVERGNPGGRREYQLRRALGTVQVHGLPKIPVFMSHCWITIKQGNVTVDAMKRSHQSSVPVTLSESTTTWHPVSANLKVVFRLTGVYRGKAFDVQRTVVMPVQPLDGWPPTA